MDRSGNRRLWMAAAALILLAVTMVPAQGVAPASTPVPEPLSEASVKPVPGQTVLAEEGREPVG